MIFAPISIAGAFVIDLEPRVDPRGSFSRAFCKREFADQGVTIDIAQCNLARTTHAGVIRGLHYQEKPAEERKIVRCLRGAVFDALVDMRRESPTYKNVFTIRLDAENRKALFIPAGVAHGYQTLADDTEFFYMTDQFYSPGLEQGVRFDDPGLGIRWPLPPRDVAARDCKWPLIP